MKSTENSNTLPQTKPKITLQDYYNSLPEATQIAPRKELILRISKRCNVPFSTARSWLAYKIKPRYEEYIRIISEEKGIAIEDLYAE